MRRTPQQWAADKVVRHQQWVSKSVLMTALVGSQLAFALTFFFQATNGRIGESLGVRWVPAVALVFFSVGEVWTLLIRRFIRRVNPKIIIGLALGVLFVATFVVRYASIYRGSTLGTAAWFVFGYILYSTGHFASFVGINTIYRMMLPEPTNPQRLGGTFWGTICYVGSSIATIILAFGETSEVWLTIAAAPCVVAFIMFLITPLPQVVWKDETSSKFQWKMLFDKKAAGIVWPYVGVIGVNNVMLSLLQFHIKGEKVMIWDAPMFVLTVSMALAAITNFAPVWVAEKIGERLGDKVVTLFAIAFAAGSQICFLTGSVGLSIGGGALLGLALCAGRISFSQLASIHSEEWGRGSPEYYGFAIRPGQMLANVIGLMLTFGFVTLGKIWLVNVALLTIGMLFMLYLIIKQVIVGRRLEQA